MAALLGAPTRTSEAVAQFPQDAEECLIKAADLRESLWIREVVFSSLVSCPATPSELPARPGESALPDLPELRLAENDAEANESRRSECGQCDEQLRSVQHLRPPLPAPLISTSHAPEGGAPC